MDDVEVDGSTGDDILPLRHGIRGSLWFEQEIAEDCLGFDCESDEQFLRKSKVGIR